MTNNLKDIGERLHLRNASLEIKMEKELSELIYNQKDICEAFRDVGIEEALQLVKNKRDKIMANVTEISLLNRRVACDRFASEERVFVQKKYLNSLNKSLYYYVLYVINPIPNDCVYHSFSFKNSYGDISRGMFLEYASRILETYKKYIHPEESQNKRIEEACRYIKEHLSEELTLEKVASQIYIGRCHLCWLFRNCKQVNFSEYVTAERLKRAKTLLADGALSIDVVSERCGFSSSSYFSTVFKKKEGISPREYRKKHSSVFPAQ